MRGEGIRARLFSGAVRRLVSGLQGDIQLACLLIDGCLRPAQLETDDSRRGVLRSQLGKLRIVFLSPLLSAVSGALGHFASNRYNDLAQDIGLVQGLSTTNRRTRRHHRASSAPRVSARCTRPPMFAGGLGRRARQLVSGLARSPASTSRRCRDASRSPVRGDSHCALNAHWSAGHAAGGGHDARRTCASTRPGRGAVPPAPTSGCSRGEAGDRLIAGYKGHLVADAYARLVSGHGPLEAILGLPGCVPGFGLSLAGRHRRAPPVAGTNVAA